MMWGSRSVAGKLLERTTGNRQPRTRTFPIASPLHLRLPCLRAVRLRLARLARLPRRGLGREFKQGDRGTGTTFRWASKTFG